MLLLAYKVRKIW